MDINLVSQKVLKDVPGLTHFKPGIRTLTIHLPIMTNLSKDRPPGFRSSGRSICEWGSEPNNNPPPFPSDNGDDD